MISLGRFVAFAIACSGVVGCWSILDLVPADDPPAEPAADAAPPPAPVRDAAASRPVDAGPPHRVFVTSTVHPGSSLASAPDSACNAAAAAASLPGHFAAWLSFTGRAAKDRLVEYGPWLTTRGQLVASDKADLTKGSVRSPITYDEHGQPFPEGRSRDLAWTGTDPSGSVAGSACDDWTGGDGSLNGTVGNVTQAGASWTADPTVTANCLSNFHVYCFEQP